MYQDKDDAILEVETVSIIDFRLGRWDFSSVLELESYSCVAYSRKDLNVQYINLFYNTIDLSPTYNLMH
jgi:hypothetical protein